MVGNVLVTNKKYTGKYVAFKSFTDNKVVASGIDPLAVIERARVKGFRSPVLLFVPSNNMTHVY